MREADRGCAGSEAWGPPSGGAGAAAAAAEAATEAAQRGGAGSGRRRRPREAPEPDCTRSQPAVPSRSQVRSAAARPGRPVSALGSPPPPLPVPPSRRRLHLLFSRSRSLTAGTAGPEAGGFRGWGRPEEGRGPGSRELGRWGRRVQGGGLGPSFARTRA